MKKFKKKNTRTFKNQKTCLVKKEKIPKKSFFIYGMKPVLEFLKHKPEKIKSIFLLKDKKIDEDFLIKIKKASKNKKIDIKSIDNKFVKNNIGEDINHQGIVAQIINFDYQSFNQWKEESEKRKKELILILDKVEDVHNFGAIIRTAAAADVSAIFVSSHKQAPINGTVFKTSAGNLLKINIVQVVNINDLINKVKKEGFWLYGLDMSDQESESIFEQKFDKKTAFVLGSEENGISKKTLEHCDFVTSIPMDKGVESLNVSVTGAVAMYEWKRQNK